MKIIPFNKAANISFNKGLRYFNTNIDKSIRYIQKACSIDPYNSEYKFSLAGAYAQLNKMEESNRLLKEIMILDSDMTICYFALGCNYLDLDEADEAIKNFRKYIFMDRDGEYFEEAQDSILYLKEKNIFMDHHVNGSNLKNLISKAKECISGKQYDIAINYLEEILVENPSVTSVRNLLSLSYFYEGRIQDAIFMAYSVLKNDEYNLNANCNLVTYYYVLNLKKEFKLILNRIELCDISKKEDVVKILSTYEIIAEDKNISNFINKLEASKCFNVNYIYSMAAISMFNICNYDRALEYLHKLKSHRPWDSVLIYYSNYFEKVKEGVKEYKKLPYRWELPRKEVERKTKFALNLEYLNDEVFRLNWSKNEEFRKEIISILNDEDNIDKISRNNIIFRIINLLDNNQLYEFINDRRVRKKLKNIIKKKIGDN